MSSNLYIERLHSNHPLFMLNNNFDKLNSIVKLTDLFFSTVVSISIFFSSIFFITLNCNMLYLVNRSNKEIVMII
jgi:hypothetical protein